MSDDIKDIKIGGISASEYVRGIKNGNIDPSFDNAVKAILWAADEIERLRRTLHVIVKKTGTTGLHDDNTQDIDVTYG